MTKTILLADDSVTIQKVVELTFMEEDFRVSAVSNGAEAIARMSESKPDVVIADVHMPGASGYEVCRRSKELYPSVPVLLLVGTFEAFDADEAVRCGADGHLKKPFDSQELMRRVRELASTPSRSAPVSAAPAMESDFAPEAAFEAPAPGGDFWKPIGGDLLPVDAAPAPPAFPALPASKSPAEMATRFSLSQSAPEAAAIALAGPAAPAISEAIAESTAGLSRLSDTDVDRIARRMIELVGDKAVRDVAWEVVPDLAEVLLKSRIRELESTID